MKKHIIDSNVTLRHIINGINTELYVLLIDDFDNVKIVNTNDPSVLIKPIQCEAEHSALIAAAQHFGCGSIESEIIEFVVFKAIPGQTTVLTSTLFELSTIAGEDGEYALDKPCWEIYEDVADDWEPPVIEEVQDVDLPVDPLNSDELRMITPNHINTEE